jgi:hypothetical protein
MLVRRTVLTVDELIAELWDRQDSEGRPPASTVSVAASVATSMRPTARTHARFEFGQT